MRDAATAAAMSDPTLNRWFRRRWVELPSTITPPRKEDVPTGDDELASTGLALLQEWRRSREVGVVPW